MNENEITRDELLSACIEMIMSLTDDEFALLKVTWDRWRETQEDQYPRISRALIISDLASSK